jgi:phosphoribosylanthranilate isomerase
MIGRITLKICGITRAEDAVAAAEIGADWLGFIFYPPSPRNLTREQYIALRGRLEAESGRARRPAEPFRQAQGRGPAEGPRLTVDGSPCQVMVPRHVAVCVEPAPADLAQLATLGFAAFQVHFAHTTPVHRIAAWAETVGSTRLWLAPRLPPGEDVKPEWLPFAPTFLLDTFHADKFGGTGRTGDWAKFSRHQTAHPGKTWILSGGLSPSNVCEAIAATGACFIDVNSGVESAPGLKDPAKLAALKTALN